MKDPPHSVEQLEERLSEPTSQLVEAFGRLNGDLVVLGAGGKMGPTLARMAVRAGRQAGWPGRVIAVSRFSDSALPERLEAWGVETVACDLLDERTVEQLPDAAHVMFMAGMKFGAAAAPPLTWAMNTYVPALVARRYRESRIAAFSTGNVYPLVTAASGGSREEDLPGPIGEYAMSALGRERTFQYFSDRFGFPLVVLRLNYAAELRYGVLVDLAESVLGEQPIDLAMSHVNVIWQGDANAHALLALCRVDGLPPVLNIAGAEVLAVNDLATRLGELLGREPRFAGTPTTDALLSDASRAHEEFGHPRMPVDRLLEWTADWLAAGRTTLGKPTHFQARDGKF